MQEAFVAALLAIARNEQPGDGEDDDTEDEAMVMTMDLADNEWVKVLDRPVEESPELDELALWVEIKKQVAILREGMEEKTA